MMPLVEVFLGASIKFLLDKLSSGDLLKFFRREGIHTKIKKWEGMLLKIDAVLTGAENQQTENKAVRLWLDDLQDLAFDLDDMLDEFATEEIKRKLDGLNPLLPSSRKVNAFLPHCCTTSGFGPRSFMYNQQMKLKMDDISTRLDYIFKQSLDLNLVKINGTLVNNPTSATRLTTSLISEPRVCGRDKEKVEIIEYLLKEEDKLGVLPIVGMGGIGKTTLCQAVYNDKDLENHFDLKAWVCVSEDFDVMRITKSILESITHQCCIFTNLDSVQVELKKQLARKKFLIILDDVWNESYGDWNVLKSPFNDGAPGSKIVVTTRHLEVASTMETVGHRILQPLPVDDCWLVFAQHAFGNRIMDGNPNLMAIGRRIVDKCKGLPLAARTIGGLLRCKERDDEWEAVLNSKIWEKGDILPALRLSYYHLPAHLKPCFMYCAIIPKDYEFSEKELVLLWMAEGFVQQERGEKQMEEIASDYFHELLSRSLFQLSSCTNGSISFVMHDLVNDLARTVSGDTCFRLEDKLEDRDYCINPRRVRYSSYIQGTYDSSKRIETLFEAKHSRTLLPFSLSPWPRAYIYGPDSYLASNVPIEVFQKLKCTRSLGLRGYRITELPDSVGAMKHMRYLDLSYTFIKRLPDSVQTLYNLQTFMLIGCRELQSLPADMGNLINLRLLDVTDAKLLREMPLGIGKIESLRILSDFIITEGSGNRIRELGKLKHLGGSLCISGLQNITNALDAKEANLSAKEKLVVLKMKWGEASSNLPNKSIGKEVHEMLKPHRKLKELEIDGYRGTGLPSWIGDPIFSNMVSIKIANCTNCSFLPPLGQLCSLKSLYIERVEGLKHLGMEFYGQSSPSFLALEILHFIDMPEWEDWLAYRGDPHFEIQPFARVKELLIQDCPKLKGTLPTNLPCLKKLQIQNCPKLEGMLPTNLPCLKVLNIENCPALIDFEGLVVPSVTSLSIDGAIVPFRPSTFSEMNSPGSSFLSSLFLSKVPIFELNKISLSNQKEIVTNVCSKSLEIHSIPEVMYLPKWLTHELSALEKLIIHSCPDLRTLFQKNNHEVIRQSPNFPVLTRMVIEKCPQVVSVFEGEEEDDEETRMQSREGVQNYITSLESLEMRECEKFQHLPRKLHMFTSLVKLTISDCPMLISFPETGFPSSLRSLEVYGCKALRSPLSFSDKNNNLDRLYVSNCPSLSWLTTYSCSNRSGLPSSLTTLIIYNCSKLEALIREGEGMKIHCPVLTHLTIGDCPSLKYLPNKLHNDSLNKLEWLDISDCKNLECLPYGWLGAIIKLREISIPSWGKLKVGTSGCSSSLPETWPGEATTGRILLSYILKEGIIFTNLTSLQIIDITSHLRPSEWALHRLSSLQELRIRGPINVSREETEEADAVKVSIFPLEGMLLPTSLTELYIRGFPDLERLSSTGFEFLSLLWRLVLYDCPKLAYFPKNGLPGSLLDLIIEKCPILEKRCERHKGQYWPIISHIPRYERW